MILAIDAGNSRVKAATFDGRAVSALWSMVTSKASDGRAAADLIAHVVPASGRVRAVVLVCVVPDVRGPLYEAARAVTGHSPIVVGAYTGSGLVVAVDEPDRLGADRIAAAAGAAALHGVPAVVVDVGTAMTVTVVDRERRIVGGAIGLGPVTAARALAQRTAQLPLVSLGSAPEILGRDTESAMRSGLYYGAVGALREIVRRFRSEVGAEAHVVLTGGSAPLLRRHWPRGCRYAPDLVLEGACRIGELALIASP